MSVQFNDIGIDSSLDWARIKKLMTIGLIAAVMVFAGDWMLGYGVRDESLHGIEKWLSNYARLSDKTLFWSALLGFIGIPLEGLSYFGVYRLMAEKSPEHAHMYRSGILGYLMFGGCGVHVQCLALVFVYNHVRAMDSAAALVLVTKYAGYFLLPGMIMFAIFFVVHSIAQISAFAKGFTPYPKWCWIFSVPVGMAAAFLFHLAGNNAFAHGITAAWISIGNIWMFGGLLLMMKKIQL